MGVANVTCTKCGVNFEVDTKYFQIFGEDPFCQNCLIHTKCQSCDRGLRLEPSRYKELGGDPIVCVDCDDVTPEPSNEKGTGSSSFWSGLTIGEKIVFPVLLAAFVGLGSLAMFAEMNGGEVSTPLLGGLFFLLYWTYRRGKKNS